MLILPGFGSRGSEGKIKIVKYSREQMVPFLGICLGLQCAIIEFARNVCKMKGANSTEFNAQTKYPVIDLMESQRAIKIKGGTMRLGAYDCEIKTGTRTYAAYRKKKISERHRHRYEVNNNLIDILVSKGLKVVGKSADKMLVEVIEIDEHPWFIGCQFHPEFTSDPRTGHPLFTGFIKAAKKNKIRK